MARKRKRIKRNARALPAAASDYGARPAHKTQNLTLVFVCIAVTVAVWLHLSSDKFPDPDAFYHFRHAEIYGSAGAGGVFRTDFPWVHHSVISKFSSDLWYGFHLVIVPFTLLDDPILGMRLAGIFITFMFLISFYAACVYFNIRPVLFWPFFLLFSSAFLLLRLSMLRPQVLSLGLSLLLLALLATESIWGVFFAALVSTFLHLNLFFVSFLVLAVFAIVKILGEKVFPWRECLALTSGVLVGWLLRPNPGGAAQILYVQLFQVTSEKIIGGSPLDFGAELLPLKLTSDSNYLLFTVLLLLSLLYVSWRFFKKDLALSSREKTILLTAASLSIVFFLISVGFARRAFDFCSGFGVILIGFVFSRYFYENRPARLVLICAFVVLVPYGVNRRNEFLFGGWDPYRFESAAKWMAVNSKPGEIVFNARWEYFPELFFWNTKNLYSNGMDPIFQYAYDRDLYRKGYYLLTGEGDPGGSKDPYRILKEDFKARYVFLAKPFDGSLYFRLLPHSGFSLKQENDTSVVFEIN